MATYTVTVKLRNRKTSQESASTTVNYGVDEIVEAPPPPGAYAYDPFNGSATGGVGTEPVTGLPWEISGATGAQYSKSAGGARIAVEDLNVTRRIRLPLSLLDVEVLFNYSTDVLATGGNQECSPMLRIDPNDIGGTYYYCEVEFSYINNAVRARIVRKRGSVDTPLTTAFDIPGLTHAANGVYWIRAQIVGATVRMRVWRNGTTEPKDEWTVTAVDPDPIMTPGQIGARATLDPGNTNTLPVNFTIWSFTASPPTGVTPPPAPLIGSSIGLNTGETWTNGLVRHDTTIGPLDIVRVFNTGLPAAWTDSKAAQCNRPVCVSFKALPADVNAGKHDAFFTSWFASLPKNSHKIWWCFYHEPEDNITSGAFTYAEFRSAFRRIAGFANAANNPNLFNTLILMAYTMNPASGRTFSNYYPGNDVVDVIGWDAYSAIGKYDSPATVYGAAIDKSEEYGKPWAICETGAMKLSSDATGSGHAGWVNDVRNYMANRNPVFLCYWNQIIDAKDYRLSTAAAQKAWSDYCKTI